MSQKSRFVLLTVLLFIFLLPDFMPCSSQPSTVGVTLCLKTPRGLPLEGAWVKIDGIAYGSGECVTARLTPGTHIVEAMWMYVELVLPPLIVTGPGTVTLTPSNIHLLTIRALGARGQALEGARVKVMKGPVEITKLTDRDGKAEIELPDGDYEIEVMYGPFVKTDSVFLTADTFKEVSLDVFVEVLGTAMSMAQFLLLILWLIILVIAILSIVIIKKRKPPLPPPPPQRTH